MVRKLLDAGVFVAQLSHACCAPLIDAVCFKKIENLGNRAVHEKSSQNTTVRRIFGLDDPTDPSKFKGNRRATTSRLFELHCQGKDAVGPTHRLKTVLNKVSRKKNREQFFARHKKWFI